ncbi:MAG TPA: hypothetical protein VF733_06880 [Candidatus Saccharimonadales bacterium]
MAAAGVYNSLYPTEYLLETPVWDLPTNTEDPDLLTSMLKARLDAQLAVAGLTGNPQIAFALDLAFAAHKGRKRTNGNYIDHPMRATIYLLDSLGVHDPDIVAADIIHDVGEDEYKRVINWYGDGNLILNEAGEPDINANVAKAFDALHSTRKLSERTLDIANRVTVPSFEEHLAVIEEDRKWAVKTGLFLSHIALEVITCPAAVVVKRSDLKDNAVDNHHTHGPAKMIRSDKKYYALWKPMDAALDDPDCIIKNPAIRAETRLEFWEGKGRAEARLVEAGVSLHGLAKEIGIDPKLLLDM